MHSTRRALPLTGALLTVAIAGVLPGCALTTQFTDLWRDPAWSEPPMKKVLVLALRKDPVRRRMWEDGLVAGLARHGVEATPSYRQFPDVVPDTQQVAESVQANGYDGVMLSTRLPDQTETTHVPGYTRTEPVTRRNLFTGAYHIYYREVEVEPQVDVNEVRFFKTDLWTTREGGRLVWSGTVRTLETVNTGMVKKIAESRIVSEIARQGLVPAKTAK